MMLLPKQLVWQFVSHSRVTWNRKWFAVNVDELIFYLEPTKCIKVLPLQSHSPTETYEEKLFTEFAMVCQYSGIKWAASQTKTFGC